MIAPFARAAPLGAFPLAALRRALEAGFRTALFGRDPPRVLAGATAAFGRLTPLASPARSALPAAVDRTFFRTFFAASRLGAAAFAAGVAAARTATPAPGFRASPFARTGVLPAFLVCAGDVASTAAWIAGAAATGATASARFDFFPSLTRRTGTASIDTGGAAVRERFGARALWAAAGSGSAGTNGVVARSEIPGVLEAVGCTAARPRFATGRVAGESTG